MPPSSNGYSGSPLWSVPTTTTLQNIVNYAQSFPDCYPVLSSVPGKTEEPALSFANDIMQDILAQGMDWKWNRKYVPPILTVALQQDYVTQVTDLSWLETGWRIDINNSTNNGNLAPKPVFQMEAVRDIMQTAYQSNPFQLCFIPNRLAFFGQWQPNTAYGCAYGVAQIPISPVQQFVDANGNILYIDSTVLGLNINSPGFVGTPIPLPTPNGYGTSGATQPLMPPNTAPGTTVPDGTVTWTVANPNGYAIRVTPLPAYSSLAWLLCPIYQTKAPWFSSLQQTLAPIPPEYTYLFRSGFIAMCRMHADSKMFGSAYAQWKEMMMQALRAADREESGSTFYPSESIMGGSNFGLPIGPAWPFADFPGGYN